MFDIPGTIIGTLAGLFGGLFGRRPPPPEEQLDPDLVGFADRVISDLLDQGVVPGALGINPVPVPVPTPAPPPSPTGGIPGFGNFPGGPAANDPIFRERLFGRIGGRVLGPGSLILLGADLLIRQLEKDQLERMDDVLERQAEDQARRDRRQERDSALRTISRQIPDFIGDRLPTPDPETRPRLPRQPVIFPDAPPPIALPPAGVPPIGVPFPSQVPEAPPGRVRLPNPRPAAQPSVVVGPGGFENAGIGIDIGRLPFLQLPFGLSRLRVGDPVPGSSLTQLQEGSVPSEIGAVQEFPVPSLAANPQPETCRPRRCDDELDEQRRECFKGLYREGLFDTDFTQWVEIDCLTGAEVSRDRSATVLDFPEREF